MAGVGYVRRGALSLWCGLMATLAVYYMCFAKSICDDDDLDFYFGEAVRRSVIDWTRQWRNFKAYRTYDRLDFPPLDGNS
jgi:hypothetical protein